MAIRAAQVSTKTGIVENIVMVNSVEESSPDFDYIPIPNPRRILGSKYRVEYKIVIGETRWDSEKGFVTPEGLPSIIEVES